MNLKKITIILIILSAVSSGLYSEDTIIPIMTTFGGRKNDYSDFVRQTEDGGYIIIGGTESFADDSADIYLIKTDSSGNELWYKTFGGIESLDNGINIVQTENGEYLIMGLGSSYETGSQDIYIIKTDSSGNEEWSEIIEGTYFDYNIRVAPTQDDGFIIMKNSLSEGAMNFGLIKTDYFGSMIWENEIGGTGDDYGYAMTQTSDSGYIITGYTNSFGDAIQNIYLVKTDWSGEKQWSQAYNIGDQDSGRSVQQTEDSGYIILGTSGTLESGYTNIFLLKTDESGKEQWANTYGGDDFDYGLSVLQTSDGGYIIAGWTYSYGAGNSADVYLIKTDNSGEELWHKVFGGTDDDYCYGIQETEDRGFIITGFTKSYGAGNTDGFLIKTDSEGNIEF